MPLSPKMQALDQRYEGAPTEADHEEARRSGLQVGASMLRPVCGGCPREGTTTPPRCVLDVTVQCKILEHAILYRVELHASDTLA